MLSILGVACVAFSLANLRWSYTQCDCYAYLIKTVLFQTSFIKKIRQQNKTVEIALSTIEKKTHTHHEFNAKIIMY